MADLRLDRISKHFGTTLAVRDLSLNVADGEFVVLLGPTGAGKTTTLRLVAGLEKPDSGSVHIGGADVTRTEPAARDVSFVFQQYSLYPHLSVYDNLAFPLRSPARRASKDDIRKRVMSIAELLRITDKLDNRATHLSGGEMQRVSIGRAIVREPLAFLMDEPLSNLDAKLREALRAELKDLQMKLGATFLFVTHDQVEAMSMGDRIGVLNEGRIAQVGTPQDIYERPRDTFVAGFVGSPAMNLLEGELRDQRVTAFAGKLELPLERAPAAGSGPVTLGIRSEDIRVGPDEASEAAVHDVENHGVEKIVTLRVDDTLFRATVPANVGIETEARVKFSWNPAKLHCFDRKSGMNLRYASAD